MYMMLREIDAQIMTPGLVIGVAASCEIDVTMFVMCACFFGWSGVDKKSYTFWVAATASKLVYNAPKSELRVQAGREKF